ncbi:hypothetical protein [Gracilinema caldarium]|uniref:Uncharacterized protein n=1 Tax=Gracilinema caldarium (strain ATCC 51460 / DSM 7334 / H1) TaxID=744872 RepID=F8F1V8_GRAC1|nr:hypothetical protein [Gracilinema caldarium]AEJ19805.1 hypothetical protein Spica_1662 [Gracilinema caldarium DSM 7334]
MKKREHIADRSVLFSVFKLLQYKKIRKAGLFCAGTALRDFFGLQYKQKIIPKKAPVYWVDHPLDERIPFVPEQVDIYLDFVYFWIRSAAFLMERFGEAAETEVARFVEDMGRLYSFAAEVYRRGFSTTRRPRYFKKLRFVIIHTFDPHLMCIPSLHVMVVCRAYTRFKAIVEKLGATKSLAPYIDELKCGAQAITESILYVKQHSVNCIPAAFYALSALDSALFPPEEMEQFSQDLFADSLHLDTESREAIIDHIRKLYYEFIEQKKTAADWSDVLVSFLETKPICIPGTKNLAQTVI